MSIGTRALGRRGTIEILIPEIVHALRPQAEREAVLRRRDLLRRARRRVVAAPADHPVARDRLAARVELLLGEIRDTGNGARGRVRLEPGGVCGLEGARHAAGDGGRGGGATTARDEGRGGGAALEAVVLGPHDWLSGGGTVGSGRPEDAGGGSRTGGARPALDLWTVRARPEAARREGIGRAIAWRQVLLLAPAPSLLVAHLSVEFLLALPFTALAGFVAALTLFACLGTLALLQQAFALGGGLGASAAVAWPGVGAGTVPVAEAISGWLAVATAETVFATGRGEGSVGVVWGGRCDAATSVGAVNLQGSDMGDGGVLVLAGAAVRGAIAETAGTGMHWGDAVRIDRGEAHDGRLLTGHEPDADGGTLGRRGETGELRLRGGGTQETGSYARTVGGLKPI